MAVAPLAIAGLALAAAGTGLNYIQKGRQESRAKSILSSSRKRVEANTAEANAQWQGAAAKTTREQQEADMASNAAERQGVYENATADAGNVALMPQSDAPQVVKTEAAKQLGDQLGKARGLMRARANIGGWTDSLFDDRIDLNRSGQQIGMLSNFSLNDASAAQHDSETTLADKGNGIGDILMGLGSAVGMAGGGIGAAGGAAGAASAASQALPLTGTVYSAASQAPGWWARLGKTATTPINFW